ncbi:MAG: semialdehyde dehydrogenase, partial [Mesorhizobium sp.]
MTTIALFGAGGKMGYRLSTNFRGSHYTIRHVEVSDVGRERLK